MSIFQQKVSHGERIDSNKLQIITLGDVLNKIKSDEKIKNITQQVRSADNKKERKELKKLLPYFNLGTFNNNVRQKQNLISTIFMILDYDGLSDTEIKDLQEKLKKNQNVFSFFLSPSGMGIKVVLRFESEITDYNQFTKNYVYYAKYYSNVLGIEYDGHTVDACRACFYSYDEKIYINEEAELLEVITFPEPNIDLSAIKTDDELYLADAVHFLSSKITKYNDWFRCGMALASLGERGRSYFIELSSNPRYNETPEEINNKFSNFIQTSEGKINLATLFDIAKSYGFTYSSKKQNVNEVESGEESTEESTEQFAKDIIRIIGELIDSSLSNDEISKIVKLWNQTNDSPIDNTRLQEEINGAFKYYLGKAGDYWKITKSKNGLNVKIIQDDFIKHLNSKGYAKTLFGKIYEFVQINQNVAKVITPQDIKDLILDELEEEKSKSSKKVKEYLLDKVAKYFSERFLETVATKEIKKMSDNKDCSYLFFKNTVVKVNKAGGYELMEYKDLPSTIWSTQIIDREFKRIEKKTKKSEFEQFLYNTVGKDEDKLLAVSSAMGYLLHRYKDKSVTKAIVLMDEAIDDQPEGRTGKSLIGKAISCFREAVRIDGKNFVFGDKFTFQQINPSSDIIEFNDVKQNFDFEKLFSVITDDMTLEYKNKHPFVLKFEESPKFLISTNYTIKGTGSSFSDRLFEIALTNHYNESHRPVDEFGHQFFDDWDEKEWSRFDHFMIECIELYLQYGLVKNKSDVITMKKLISETSEEFIEFIESRSFVKNSEYQNHDLYFSYKSKMKVDFDTMQNNIIDIRKFMKYVRKWAGLRGYEFRERKANGKQYFGVYYDKVTK